VQNAPADTASPPSSRNCRTYKGDAIIDSSRRPFYGRACLESDGHWHVVQ
jgi:surface antigen